MVRTIRTLSRWAGAPWAAITFVLVLAAVLLYTLTGPASGSSSLAPGPSADDITLGPADAATVMIEYSDFQCSYCAAYAGLLLPLRDQYQGRVRFVFRFFPLSNHPFGQASAQAAYAAHLQGKFWEMHDLLFANQQDWSDASDPTPYFEAYASALGLELDRFRADYAAPATREFILAQKAGAETAGIDHTPWFIVNGKVVTPRTAGQFQELWEAGT